MVQILTLKFNIVKFIIKFKDFSVVFTWVSQNWFLFFPENVQDVSGRFDYQDVLSGMIEFLDITIKIHDFSLSESIWIDKDDWVVIHGKNQIFSVFWEGDILNISEFYDKKEL